MTATLPPPAAPLRARDRLARLAEAVTTPLLPADYLDLFAPLRSGAELRGRVLEVRPETRDAATLVIRPGADWAGHVPGQYVRVGVDVDGVRHWRAYSLTQGPRDRNITITVKAVPDGIVSNHLVHASVPGTLVHLEQATGEFVLPDERRPLLFVTAGSGITPVIGMLRNLFPTIDAANPVSRLERNEPDQRWLRCERNEPDQRWLRCERSEPRNPDIVVLHVAPSRPDSIFIEDLETLDRAGAIRLLARYDDQHGILDLEQLGRLVPDLAARTTYACGPTGLLDALADHHAERGLTLFTEQFRPTLVEAGDGGSITFTRSDTTTTADGATPILQAGEDAGVLMPSGCRMGVCFGCVVPLQEGAARDLRNGALTTAVPGETAPGGVPIQTCISAAAGPCRIDL